MLISAAVALQCAAVGAQEPAKHPAKMYKAPDGKLYTNKEMPVYLWISGSGDESATKIRLESQQHAKYTNPFYFDTEGLNTVRSPSLVDTATRQVVWPLQDIVFEVYTDSRPPRTTLRCQGGGLLERGGKRYVSGEARVTLEATDALSGVEATYVSVDGGPYQPYQGPLTLADEREHMLRYYSVDHVGNAEQPRQAAVVVDRSKPRTQVRVEGDSHGEVVSGRSRLALAADDAGGSGVRATRYALDAQPARRYDAPIAMAAVAEGEHTLRYWSEDHMGNAEDTAAWRFYVDKSAPMAVEEVVGGKFVSGGVEYSSGRGKYKITAMDNKAGVREIRYSVNGGPYQPYTEPFALDAAKGAFAVRTVVVDNVGNRAEGGAEGGGKATRRYVDMAGPRLGHKIEGASFAYRDTVYVGPGSRVALAGSDSESGMAGLEYADNGGPAQPYGGPFALEGEGAHSVAYTGYDKVGNTNMARLEAVVDARAPEIRADFSVPPVGSKVVSDSPVDVYPRHVNLFLSATDDRSGLSRLTYSLGGAQQQPYAAPIKGFAPGSDVKVEVVATDMVGNASRRTIQFSVD